MDWENLGLLIKQNISPTILSELEIKTLQLDSVAIPSCLDTYKIMASGNSSTAKSIVIISNYEEADAFYPQLGLPPYWDVKEQFKTDFGYSDEDILGWCHGIYSQIANSMSYSKQNITPVQISFLFYSMLGGFSIQEAMIFSQINNSEFVNAVIKESKIPIDTTTNKIKTIYDIEESVDFVHAELSDLYLSIKDLIDNYPLEVGMLAEDVFLDEDRTIYLMNLLYENSRDLRQQKKTRLIGADIGAGTGIGAFALLASGIDLVYAVDLDHNNINLINYLAKELGYNTQTKIRLRTVHTDALDWYPSKRLDIVFSETFHTGGYREAGCMIMPHIAQFATEDSVIIPDKMCSYIQIFEDDKPLSPKIMYDSRNLVTGELYEQEIDVDTVEVYNSEGGIEAVVNIPIRETGYATIIRIESELYSGETNIPSFEQLMPPFDKEISLPVTENFVVPIHVKIIYGGNAIQIEI